LQSRNRLKADLILLLVALIWGSAFVAQRHAALEMGAFLFNGIRFWVGALVLLPLFYFTTSDNVKTKKFGRKEFLWVILAGFLLFVASAFQQFGMKYTTAGNAGFITGLYVVLIPVLLSIIWREKINVMIWVAAVFSIIGLFLLSTNGNFSINPGDLLELIGACFWAFHVILIGRLVNRIEIKKLAIGQYLVCGSLSLILSLLVEKNALSGITESWWAIVYTGIVSIGLGYTLQAVGQRFAPAPDAAIIMSLESVFAAFAGWIFLGELLNLQQIMGCMIIFSGMLLAQLAQFDFRNRSRFDQKSP
jgi:drug/metabolite transporter (DMT)-like permease